MASQLSIDDILAAQGLPPASGGGAPDPTAIPTPAQPAGTPPISVMSGYGGAQPPGPGRMMFNGIPSAPTTAAPAPQNLLPASFSQPATPATPSFFGQGGSGRNLVGIFGDMLSVGTGHQATYAPAMAKRQEYQQELQKQQLQQNAELQRQQALAAFKVANPDPTEFQRDYSYLGQLDPTGGLQRNFATQKSDGPPTIGTIDGVTGLISRGSVGGGQSATPQPRAPSAAAINHLRANPTTKADFDEYYGPGLADAILGTGGASPQTGSPTFR